MKLTSNKCFVAYWVIALLTFGYVASGSETCSSIPRQDQRSACLATAGLMAAPLWPLYWTWEGFDAGRQALKGRDHG